MPTFEAGGWKQKIPGEIRETRPKFQSKSANNRRAWCDAHPKGYRLIGKGR